MKLSKIAMLAAIACASYTSSMTASANDTIELVSHRAAACDCGEPVCGCETVGSCCDPCGDACDGGLCNAGCDGGCDSACGCGSGSCLSGLLGDCCLGEPWSLFGERNGVSMGGWLLLGYHDRALPAFNDRPDEYNLHQAWLYAEKAIDTSCGFDIGGRIDYVYGIDAQNTQAFGTGNRGWDNKWDNGGANGYGNALPQAYFETGYGDLTVKIGHFFTIIGWEVVPATGNFFYSHAYTMNFSEPFTHTGALATYQVNPNVTAYGGYTMGWDSGFDDNGDSFLGGLSVALSDDMTLTYATTFGRIGALPLGTPEQGYMHSIVADIALSDSWQYIFQTDYLDTETSAGATVRNTFDINQYLIKTINDCWAAGGRFEYYNNEGIFGAPGTDSDIYALTLGLNYKPHANVMVRPEIRWDWDDDQVAGLAGGAEQTTFGIDTIYLF